jgi:hypothetical protein
MKYKVTHHVLTAKIGFSLKNNNMINSTIQQVEAYLNAADSPSNDGWKIVAVYHWLGFFIIWAKD